MKSNFARIYSAQPHHLKGHIVTVEVDYTIGIHRFTVIGLAGKAVDEARERIGSALKNCGWPSPKTINHKTVISLAPAELPKNGSYFDVAMALGYLRARRSIDFDIKNKVFLGELALNGDILPVKGVLPIAQTAKDQGFQELYVPKENAAEAALVSGITVYPLENLNDAIYHLYTRSPDYTPLTPQPPTRIEELDADAPLLDMSHIKGQEAAKRGLEIAAAGGHNIAMYGPPGTGKTTLAKAFRDILPPLTHQEILEITGIHSIAGVLSSTLIQTPPFRSPHHTASYVSLIGGGSRIKPGEVTLAHKGVLFMDEFPEFEPRVLESLRQPLEDKKVHITRASGSATFPTDFILVAALNPPPEHASEYERQRHFRRISGPIVDRIDMWVPVEHIDYELLRNPELSKGNSSSLDIKERIVDARKVQQERFSDKDSPILNAHMNITDIEGLDIEEKAELTLKKGAQKLELSPRGYHRMIKLARTIADLEKSDTICEHHILEALQYRPKW